MACCWSHSDIPYGDVTSWSDSTEWIHPIASGSEVFWSGRPDFLAGEVGDLAWRVYADALSQWVQSYASFSHFGTVDAFTHARTFVQSLRGGLHPVVVLAVPDLFINSYAGGAWRNKFHWSTALDFTGDLNTEIPRQIKAMAFYQNFVLARNEGRYGLTSELDIDINFSWVYFSGLEYAGGSVRHNSVFLTEHRSMAHFQLSGKRPRRRTDLSGVVVPVITVGFSRWVQALQTGTVDSVITEMVLSGPAPAPEVPDDSIIAGLNRIYPQSEGDNVVGLKIFEDVVDWDVSDWQDLHAVQELIDLCYTRPVQTWAPPDDFLGGVDGS